MNTAPAPDMASNRSGASAGNLAPSAADRLPLSKKAIAAIAAARTWEHDRVAEALASSRRGWIAASIGGALALLGFGMATFQSLRPPAAPYPVVIDKTTGETTVVATLDPNNVPALAVLDQHNAAVFVRARESYNFQLLQRDYDQVARMTVPETWAPYGGQFVGDRALQSVIAGREEHRITVVSVRLTRVPGPGRSGEAVVTFDRQVRPTQGPIPAAARFVSTVRYEYRPAAMKRPADRIDNPFGFVVTGYRADADLIAPYRPAEAIAGATS